MNKTSPNRSTMPGFYHSTRTENRVSCWVPNTSFLPIYFLFAFLFSCSSSFVPNGSVTNLKRRQAQFDRNNTYFNSGFLVLSVDLQSNIYSSSKANGATARAENYGVYLVTDLGWQVDFLLALQTWYGNAAFKSPSSNSM